MVPDGRLVVWQPQKVRTAPSRLDAKRSSVRFIIFIFNLGLMLVKHRAWMAGESLIASKEISGLLRVCGLGLWRGFIFFVQMARGVAHVF